jgi:hypothetical protein
LKNLTPKYEVVKKNILLLWLVKIKRQTFFIESRDRILTAIVVMVVCVIMIWSNMKYLKQEFWGKILVFD